MTASTAPNDPATTASRTTATNSSSRSTASSGWHLQHDDDDHVLAMCVGTVVGYGSEQKRRRGQHGQEEPKSADTTTAFSTSTATAPQSPLLPCMPSATYRVQFANMNGDSVGHYHACKHEHGQADSRPGSNSGIDAITDAVTVDWSSTQLMSAMGNCTVIVTHESLVGDTH
jgi:hypothetical protein